MPISGRCDDCGEPYSFESSRAGKSMPCRMCGSLIKLPKLDAQKKRRLSKEQWKKRLRRELVIHCPAIVITLISALLIVLPARWTFHLLYPLFFASFSEFTSGMFMSFYGIGAFVVYMVWTDVAAKVVHGKQMDQLIRFLFGVVGVYCAVAIVAPGFLHLQWQFYGITKSPLNQLVKMAFASPPGHDQESFTIKEKIAFIEQSRDERGRTSTACPIFGGLPLSLLAASPTEIGTLVTIDTSWHSLGWYGRHGLKEVEAFGETRVLRFWDVSTKQCIGTKRFSGGPSNWTAKGAVGAGRFQVEDEKIARYIASLPRQR